MFKLIQRGAAPKIRREWYCDVCENQWRTVHDEGEHEAYSPECPDCASADVEQVRRPVGVKTNASRAVEFAYKMAEGMGETNIRDNARQGDTTFMPPPPIQTAEAEAITRELVAAGAPPEIAPHLKPHVQNFFGSATTGQTQAQSAAALGIPTDIATARAMAAPAVAAANGMGADPVGLVHAAGRKGLDPLSRQNLRNHSKMP